jgi:hypothetical protein
MKAQFEQLISRGRSTSGAPQPNDVAVRRYPQPAAAAKRAKKANE